MTFNYQVDVSDPSGVGASVSSVLSSDLAQALDIWSGYIDGKGTMDVNLVFSQTSTGRLSGGPTSMSPTGYANGVAIVEPGKTTIISARRCPIYRRRRRRYPIR